MCGRRHPLRPPAHPLLQGAFSFASYRSDHLLERMKGVRNVRTRTKLLLGAAGAAALIVGVGGAAVAAGGDDDQPLTGTTKDRAVAAALAATGGGTVTETEVGDDGAAYGVEVRRGDGSQVEVNLDSNFRVTGQEADEDGAGEDG
jgi:uncharacterized membrane protein YkoI